MGTLAAYSVTDNTSIDRAMVITVKIGEPSMERDEIGFMQLKYAFTVEWYDGAQMCFYDSNSDDTYIYTPFGPIDADSVFRTLGSFMEACAETHNFEFHRMDLSCSDNFHNMSERVANSVMEHIWAYMPDPNESDIDDESEMGYHSGL